ncbi:Aste57867_25502 [Aphanomyces stellatus]|uniref:Aste57867_25502 protein n=1 Tax=Aphanomyces stellatus TaxID=120398 RepID=A0A485LT83_9STRA|nr:hypothetical protein As57867_025423 [Aphanomyces stellatus]VFU02125.1 Aste57867_25502 [Aphanomyces stellatus]
MPRSTTTRELSNDERRGLFHSLLRLKVNGKLPRGCISVLTEEYRIGKSAINKIWKQGLATEATSGVADVSSRKKGRSGRKPKRTIEEIEEKVKSAPPFFRSTYASLAASTGVPATVLWRLVKAKKILRRTSCLKPLLSDKHINDRLEYVQSFVCTGAKGSYVWHDMMDRVHIDEKWYIVTKVNRRYYLWEDEELPVRKCKSKRHLTKVMFLTTVARPRWAYKKRVMWDGKIGTWPFVELTHAQRKSKNRPRGAPIVSPITVTKLSSGVWPGQHRHTIYIQQDNAKPHVGTDDKVVRAAGRVDGWDIQLTAQLAMSPDFNVLDLGFFNAIQSLQYQSLIRTIEDLVEKTFMTLQKVMEESLKLGGDNSFLLPYLRKNKHAKDGSLVLQPKCDSDAIAAIEAMVNRIDYERRVDILCDLFNAGCNIHLSASSSQVEDICSKVDDDEDVYDDM